MLLHIVYFINDWIWPILMCLQVDMSPKQRTQQRRKDFWMPIDCTLVVRPIVGSDEMTQDSQETQGETIIIYLLQPHMNYLIHSVTLVRSNTLDKWMTYSECISLAMINGQDSHGIEGSLR